MADKMANEIVIPSCSNYEVTDTELITGKNRKRELSISESEFEYNDHTDLSKCETSTNKKNPCKDNQSSAICKSRISEQSLSDVIQKLTKQIEQIEKEVALSQNFMKNTKVNDEPIYQPPNKIIKYDVEVISAESCNSDENNIRSTKNVNTTKHVNKKIKLDKNISFQKDVSDDSERDCKSLTNEEVEVLLELPYNFDDKIIFDNEDNTHIKIHDGQTNEKNRFVCKDDVIFFETEIISNSNKIISQNCEDDRNDFNEKVLDKEKLTGLNCGKSVISVTDNKISINDSVSIPEHADKLNMSMEHVFNESMLNSNKIGFSTEDQIVSVSNDCSENIINQSEGIHFSEIEVNGDEVLETRACEDNADNSDAKSIHQDGLLDLTKGEHYEIAPYRGKCTSIINEGIKCKSVTFNNQIKSSLVKLCNSKNKTISINKLNESDYYEEETVEEIIEQTIEDIMVSLDSSNSFCFGIINLSKNIKDFENILEPVDNYCMNSESLTNQEKICLVLPHESKKTESEIYKSNNNIDTSSKSISNKKLIEVKEDDEKISDYDNTTDKIIHSVNIPDLADTLNTSIKHLFNESILDSTKIDISTDDKSMSQSNDCSESSINQSLEYVNVGEVLALVPEMNDDNVDNCDPESIDQDDLLDLTNCENDEIMLNHENCTSIINNGINSTMPFVNVNFETQIDCEETTHCSGDSIHETDFERIIVPEGKLNDSTKHVDDQEYVCEIRSNQEKNNFEPSNIEDDLFGVHIVDFHSKVNCENNINQRDLLDINAYANNQTMLENKNNTLKMIPGQKNESTLKRLTVQEEEIRTELFNNDVDELGRVTDCTDTVTTSQTCEDYIYENVFKKFKNQDDLLEVTLHISDENTSLTSEEKISDQPVKHNTLGNYENDDTIFNNKEININNDVGELGIVMDFTDNGLLEVTRNKCEANANKISEGKRNFSNDEAFILPVKVSEDVSYNGSSTNCGMKVTLSPDQRNQSTLKTLAVEEEEMLTKLVNNEDDELRMVTVCTDKVSTPHTCEEDYSFEKNITDDEVLFDYLNSNSLSSNCSMDVTTVDNYDDTISERKSQSSVTGDQFTSNMFYFGTENCRDVSVHTIHSLDGYEMNCSKNNTTVPSMENNNSFVCLNDFENILELVDESNMNSESLTTQEKMGSETNSITNTLNKLQRTGSETYEYNNNIDTSSKSISNKKLIEVKEDDEKISDYDNTTDKIIHSVNIPDLADTLNTSIKHLFNESILDSTKIDISTDDKSMSQSNDCSESSINQSLEYVNVGEVLALVPEMNDDNVDNCDPESIDQDDLLDLTNCENDEIMLNHENCTSIINNGINSTMPFVNVNFETQIDCEETTHCSGDSIHETDFERIIVPEGKLNDSTKHVDDQEYVCEIRSNQEKNNFEPSNIEDDLFGVHIVDFHSKVNCENNINQRDLLDINAYANNQTMLENKNNTLKMIPGQKNESTLKRLTVQEEEIRTELFNNDVDELGRVTDCTDTVTTSQTCEDYIYENVFKKFKNQDDLLEVTLHISDENTSLTSEEKRSDQPVKHNTLGNYENDDTIFNNEEINISTERCLSFNSSDARRILESSGDGSEHLDDSLLFKPSDRDLFRYGIECEEYENSISQSLNNLENNVGNKEVIPHCKSPSLKFNEISKTINNFVSSSYVKDYEDNVIDFYDCDLSSIENSDVEDNLLLSFENDSSIDDCIFNEKGDKLKNATNSTSNEQTCKNSLKIQNVGSPSESRNNLTNVETPVSLIHSPSHEHQNNKIMSTSISMKQMGMNPDTDDKLESFNHSDVKIAACNTVHSINESNNINRIDSDDLCKDQGELKSNFNEDQNLEVLYENHNQNNENKTYSEYNTHQNIEKSLSPYKDSGFESSKVSSVKNTENEEITKINTVKSTSSDINQSEIEKKKYLDEIIKNEQLLNNFDEKLDVNESIVSPYISQSLAKSTNLKSALAKKAAANINIRDMGDKALSTYLTQQTMTLDVLKVLHKSLDTCPSSGVLMEDPEGLVVPLMPHQKHAIAWLIWRESQEPRGGILADDMGLGKTLSMISLILKLKEKLQDSLLPLEESIDNKRNDFIIGGTLVICPASLINQWETEVKTKLKPGLLKVGQYYGINRNFSALELAENDLVITSYHVVMWDHKIRQNSSPLYKIKWDRVILDEGHNIRNHKTQTSVAVCNIKSLNRWAITGTPIHNKEADFFTLLKFVRCKPFDDWPVWKRWVGNNDDAGKHRLSLLVKTLMLRRTKTELTQFTTFNLPVKKIITIEIELSKEERNAYEKLLLFSSNLFATYLYDRAAKEKLFDPSIKVQCKVQYFQEQSQDKDKVFKDHPELLKLFKQFKNIDEIQTYHILVLLLRLRQMCCHPILIKGPITEESIKKEDNMESIPEDDIDATYNDSCNENKDIDTSPNNIDLSDLMSCLTLEDEPVKIKSVVDRNIFQKTYVSSKIKKICDLVNQKILINGGNDKAIIVSQWPSFLYLIKKNLAHYNAKIEMFSGAIPIQKRNKIIRDFNNPDEGPQILLLSLKAGGVGLNLMAANHMFLIDVHWNPQLEAQACDRVYRVGQIKPVYIYKFISNNTIETRILNIQTLKLQIAENLFKGTSVASSKITIDDLKQIFQFH